MRRTHVGLSGTAIICVIGQLRNVCPVVGTDDTQPHQAIPLRDPPWLIIRTVRMIGLEVINTSICLGRPPAQ